VGGPCVRRPTGRESLGQAKQTITRSGTLGRLAAGWPVWAAPGAGPLPKAAGLTAAGRRTHSAYCGCTSVVDKIRLSINVTILTGVMAVPTSGEGTG
jgi:hypothetical protein